jgi:periplasmic protein TonB
MIEQKSEALAEQVGEDSPEHQERQHRRMIVALALLLVALAMLLIKDREFWIAGLFGPDAAEEEQTDAVETASQPQTAVPGQKTIAPAAKAKKHSVPAAKTPAPEAQMAPVVTNRAALPPLEVEVVAGDQHRVVHPGSNSVKVELQPGTIPQPGGEAVSANVVSGPATSAAERVRLSPNASLALVRPVSPDYPLLARQMKVQGSVLMQALISREGTIQDLQVLSGPAILAVAAREAVKQWRFKPYYQGKDPVETEARITVNFTISTN